MTTTNPRVVLVTGAGTGIGAATAAAFVANGDRVAGLYAHTTPGIPGVLPVQADLTDTETVNAAFDRVESELGPVEVLVAAAGVHDDHLLMQMAEEQFTSVIDTNLIGTFRLAKRAIRPMVKARRGRIILISSAASLAGVAGQTNYTAAKAGLAGFARSLAREVATRNITVNVIAPGWTDTPMTAGMTPEQRAAAEAQIPTGQFAQPEDIAQAALYLAAARCVTGLILPVDSGSTMGH